MGEQIRRSRVVITFVFFSLFSASLFKTIIKLSSMRPKLPTETLRDLWTGQSGQFVDLELYRGPYTMDIDEFMLLSSNQWLPLMDCSLVRFR